MRKSLVAALVAGPVLLVAAWLLASVAPATATPATAPVVCSTWTMRSATGAYPDVTFGPAPAGSSVGQFSATLKKPTTGVQPGVEFVSKNLNLTTTALTTVRVDYSLAGASFASGAIRLFGYEEQNANTLTDAPDWQDTATSEDGILTLQVPAGKSIGTLGLVYDASNDGEGTVTFSALRVGVKIVRFTPCPPLPHHSPSTRPSTSASPSASTSASPSASPSVTRPPSPSPSPTRPPVSSSPQPSVSPTAVPPPVEQTPVSGSLPLTGPGDGAGKLWMLAGLGGIMIVSGGVALVLTRRRRSTFSA